MLPSETHEKETPASILRLYIFIVSTVGRKLGVSHWSQSCQKILFL